MSGTLPDMAISFLRTANSDAADFLRGKTVVGRDTFLALTPELRAKAISVAGVFSTRTVSDIVEAMAGIPEGGDWEATRADIAEQLRPHLAPETRLPLFTTEEEDEKTERMLTRRAENLLRINAGQAYSVAKTRTLDENRDIFPYREYLTMEDSRVRPSHAALNHLVLPADHPFWDTHTPPWEYGCRCDLAGVSAEEAGEIREEEEARGIPREQMSVLDDDHLQQLAQGRLMRGNGFVDLRTQREREGADGYEWNPRSLAWPREQILATIADPAARKKWEAWAKQETIPGGTSVWDWAGGQA